MGKSSRVATVLAGARVFCLALLTLLCESRVGAVTFTFSGFEENYFHLVSNSSWIFNSTTGCLKFDPGDDDVYSLASGRFLYPLAVQMIDSGSTSVKSFSTSFIYQLQLVSDDAYLGPGLVFIIVPDNSTLGGPRDFMGLITQETTETAKNYESDNHTLGVELDAYRNVEFNDTNNNHIGINLASMTSVYSFKPVYILASSSTILYQQIWIDYFEADSRMDIYYANYKEGKPAEPQGSQSGLDLSLLKEKMYIGFSTAHKLAKGTVPHVCSWSFSNDIIPAPSIVLAPDATPGAPSPPKAPPPNGPIAAPSSPPPVPPRSPASGHGHGPPINLAAVVGGPVGGAILIVVLCLVLLCWVRVFQRPLRIFISHSGGPTGGPNRDGKHFPSWLYQEISRHRWSRCKFRVKPFLDVKNCPKGLPFAGEILKELERFDVGIVVVTPDFFSKHWPMTELIKFVEVQKKVRERSVRVLPLFLKLTPDELNQGLDEGRWEGSWVQPEGDHSLKLQECRDAVRCLCRQTGIKCFPGTLETDYMETILKELDIILCRERSFETDLRWAKSWAKNFF